MPTEERNDLTPVEVPRPSVPMYSNSIVVNGEIVPIPKEFTEQGLSASNFMQDGEQRFKATRRAASPIHFVLHETCGNTAKGCIKTLSDNGYGVQLIMHPSGHISCHADLVLDQVIHANQLNGTSFGVEVVNPYAPKYVRDKALWSNIIPAQWWTWCPEGDRRYVTPTEAQMKAARLLVPWLCTVTGVQYRFPTKGLNKKKPQIDGLKMKPKGRPGPGVVAHRDFASHSDGRYMLEDLISRAS